MHDLVTTTRSDEYLSRLRWNDHEGTPSRYLLLSYHLDRLRDAAAAHDWPDVQQALSYDALHEKCQAAIASYDGNPSQAHKIRITLSRAGLLTATASPILNPLKFDPTSPSFSKPLTDSATLYGPPMTLFVDTKPTPTGLFTSTKTTERAVYDAARARVRLPPIPSHDADVILYNPQLHITESSVSNVAFYRSDVWITPPLASGCLPGVLRRWLLQHKRIREAAEGEITKDQMQPGDWVLLFNSVHGCRLGQIHDL
ncbi:aminotransferase [Mycena maculata]|uniref:Aminotransferase n=1 Tax=Mycena maculata TaxID=230809 RepID=A0AAD7IX90_9AGAR|nr:aminotransferase [Mycena maculata]